MSRWLRARGVTARLPRAGGGWRSFAAGAVVGTALGWLAHALHAGGSRGGTGVEEVPEPRPTPVGPASPRGSGTWEAVIARLDEARAALIRAEALDVEAVGRRVAAEPGGDEVRVRELGPGIIELVGRARDRSTGARLVALAAVQPGVDSVVNRIWTASPES